MAEFINFQADVDTTDSEFEEEVNDDRDEVTSGKDDSFVDDNDPLMYYQLQNVSKTADEAINDFLINDKTVGDKISNYCQESSSDDEDYLLMAVSDKNICDKWFDLLLFPRNLLKVWL